MPNDPPAKPATPNPTIRDLASRGGQARAKALTPEARQEIARKAAESRWKKATGSLETPPPRPTPAPIRPAAVIALANQKGGVGKTTSAINLACALTMDGYRVLLVDIDPQANATVHLGVNTFDLDKQGRTLSHVLRGALTLSETVIDTGIAGYYLIPSSISLAAVETEFTSDPHGGLALKEHMPEIRNDYDFIILDCPPHLGLLTVNALTVAGYVLIPVQTEPAATLGISFLLDTVDKTRRRANPHLRVLGLLPTMYSARQTQDRSTLEDLHTDYADRTRIFTPILRSTFYAQSFAAGAPTLEAAPQTPGIDAYRELARDLVATIQAETRHGA